MSTNFLPALAWMVVLAAGVAIVIEAVNNRTGTRQVVQVIVGAFLVLAFLANAWTGFTHWAACSDEPYSCDEDLG